MSHTIDVLEEENRELRKQLDFIKSIIRFDGSTLYFEGEIHKEIIDIHIRSEEKLEAIEKWFFDNYGALGTFYSLNEGEKVIGDYLELKKKYGGVG